MPLLPFFSDKPMIIYYDDKNCNAPRNGSRYIQFWKELSILLRNGDPITSERNFETIVSILSLRNFHPYYLLGLYNYNKKIRKIRIKI